jgi:glutaredoxin
MAEVKIYSATGCPYAHRTRLALLEKGVDFTLTEIDLENKPEWFTDTSIIRFLRENLRSAQRRREG